MTLEAELSLLERAVRAEEHRAALLAACKRALAWYDREEGEDATPPSTWMDQLRSAVRLAEGSTTEKHCRNCGELLIPTDESGFCTRTCHHEYDRVIAPAPRAPSGGA